MVKRNTTIRDRHRAIIRRGEPPCALCGQPIDYTLPHLDPGEFTVDHIVPLGPSPTPERIAALDVLSNKQPAHRACNRGKSDRMPSPKASKPEPLTTSRTWTPGG